MGITTLCGLVSLLPSLGPSLALRSNTEKCVGNRFAPHSDWLPNAGFALISNIPPLLSPNDPHGVVSACTSRISLPFCDDPLFAVNRHCHTYQVYVPCTWYAPCQTSGPDLLSTSPCENVLTNLGLLPWISPFSNMSRRFRGFCYSRLAP